MGGWVGGGMGGWMDTNIYITCLRQVVAFAPKVIIIACLRQGFLHSQNKVIKCAAYGVAQGRGWRYGFINIHDMYNNDVGKGVVYAYEAYEVK
jgi:hypothetical protein